MKDHWQRTGINSRIFLKSRNILSQFLLGLMYLFCVHLSAEAILKFLEEPATTQRTYKFGDNEIGIELPLITFCPKYLNEHQKVFQNQCGISETITQGKNFQQLVLTCLQANSDVNLTHLVEKLHGSIESQGKITAYFTDDGTYLEEDAIAKMWSQNFHPHYGLCETFHLGIVDSLRFLPKNGKHKLLFTTHVTNMTVFLHESNDLPDVSNSYVELNTDAPHRGLEMTLEKKIISQTPLQRLPCTDNEFLTCQELMLNMKLQREHSCWSEILYGGKYLAGIVDTNGSSCSEEVILKVLISIYALSLVEKVSVCFQ